MHTEIKKPYPYGQGMTELKRSENLKKYQSTIVISMRMEDTSIIPFLAAKSTTITDIYSLLNGYLAA